MSASPEPEDRPVPEGASPEAASQSSPTPGTEHLYAIAQVLAQDPASAAELLKAAHARVGEEPMTKGHDPAIKLLQAMMALRPMPAEPGVQTGPVTQRPLRQEVLSAFLRRRLPSSWLVLPEPLRLVLLMCEVQQWPEALAAEALGLAPAVLAERRQVAMEVLREVLVQEMTRNEHYVLEEQLTPERLREALRSWLGRTLAALPPTLSLGAPADVPPTASPRRRRPPRSRERTSPSARRALVAMLIILGTGLAGYLATNVFRADPVRDILRLSAESGLDVQSAIPVETPDQAELFFSEEYDWLLEIPEIEAARLAQIGIREIASGVLVPMLVFEDQASTVPIVLYVYSYAFLDSHTEHIELDAEVVQRIAQDGAFDQRSLGGTDIVVWRSNDDIFVAVTPQDGDALRDRIAAREQ